MTVPSDKSIASSASRTSHGEASPAENKSSGPSSEPDIILHPRIANTAVVDSDGQILKVNERWREFAASNGATAACTVDPGANYFEACNVSEEDSDSDMARRARQGLRRVLQGEQSSFEMVYPCHGPDTERWFRMEVVAVDHPRACALVSHYDVTTEKQQARRIQQSQRMETVGILAGGIVHHFNNILHVAMSSLELALDALPENGSSREFLLNVESGLARAKSIVDQLLMFSRQKSNEIQESVDLAEVVQDVFARASIPDGLLVRTDYSSARQAIGNPSLIRRAIKNVVDNAVQAMEENSDGGKSVRFASKLDVSVNAVRVADELATHYPSLSPGWYVRVTIGDTGPGMTASTKGRIFEPFLTEAGIGKGATGLGLSVVYGILRIHGGAVVVFSEVGVGSTVNLFFPAAVKEEDSTGESVGSEGEGATDRSSKSAAHILVVDDEEHVVELEAVRLQRLGYRVTTCSNGDAALEAVTSAPDRFDLVLTDFVMPGLSGLELTEELRARGYDLPVVLMSGFSAQASEDEVVRAGAETLLKKPVSTEELKDTLGSVL